LQSLNQDDFSILAFGWDYGFGHDGGGDSTFILEHQRMMGVDKSTRQALSYFQNDLLLGYRLAFNDVMGKELFFSIIYDLEKENGDEFIYTIRYAQRLSDVWSTTFDLRVIDAAPVDPNNPLGVEFFDEDQQFTFKLKRYF
jgi:hypothetical protein